MMDLKTTPFEKFYYAFIVLLFISLVGLIGYQSYEKNKVTTLISSTFNENAEYIYYENKTDLYSYKIGKDIVKAKYNRSDQKIEYVYVTNKDTVIYENGTFPSK